MNLNDYKGILVFAEQRDGILQNVGLELLGKATELAYEINKQIALKDAGDELADFAGKKRSSNKKCRYSCCNSWRRWSRIKNKVADVKKNNPDAARVTALLVGHNIKILLKI